MVKRLKEGRREETGMKPNKREDEGAGEGDVRNAEEEKGRKE